MSESLAIRDAVVFGAAADVLRPMSVLVRDGVISVVSPSLPDPDPAIPTLDAAGMLLLPGFVDAHTHVAQAFGKGVFDGQHLTGWLAGLRRSYGALSDEEVYVASMLGCLEAIRSGTTFISDMATAGDRYDVVAEAIAASGLRASISAAFIDRYEGMGPDIARPTDRVLGDMEALHARWNGQAGGRLSVAVSPVGLPGCSDALLQGAAELAARLGAQVHTHCSEEREATLEARERFGCSEVQALHAFGLLGPRTQLAHCVWVDDADIDLLAETQSSVVHCPSTNLKVTDGIAPVARMRDRDVTVALGCDGAASSGTYDILQEARLASLLAKGATMDAGVLPNHDVYAMLTTKGAKAVGLEGRIGRLEPGYRADLVLVNRHALHLLDDERLLSNLVFSATAGDVDTVIVDGRVLLRHGESTSVDEDAFASRVRSAMRQRSAMA